jgi:RNA polymerase primary sigma factor
MIRDFETLEMNEFLRGTLKDCPPMSRREEDAVIDIMLDESRPRKVRILARNKLISSHSRLAYKIAMEKARGSGRSIADLYQAAQFGMILATFKFNKKYGVRFTSFAVWWILQQINWEIYVANDAVHVPKYTKDKMRDLLKDKGKLDLTPSEIREFQIYANAPVVSIDHPVCGQDIYDSDKLTYADLIEAEYREIEQVFSRDEDHKLGEIIKGALSEHDLKILKDTYLNCYTQEEMGSFRGLSGERMRQKKNRAVLRAQSALKRVMKEKDFIYSNRPEDMSVKDILE